MPLYTLMPVCAEDADACVALLSDCRDFQRSQGFVQWRDGFPKRDLILSDIAQNKAYAVKNGEVIVAYMYLGFAGEPAYDDLIGYWNYPGKYGVIHRLGISSVCRGTGLSCQVFSLAEDLCRKREIRILRIDTHFPNTRMQHVLLKNGFSYAGIVRYGSMFRMAYDKTF